jgi:lysophospholipase L1-like esterase
MLPTDGGAAVTYVALGDSTVEGIGASADHANYVSRLHARLRERYPRASLANLGVGGATSEDVVAAQVDRAVALRPQLVTLSVGPNDITSGVPVRMYAQNLETILGRLVAETEAVIVVNLLPDLAITPRFRGREMGPVVGRLSRRVQRRADTVGEAPRRCRGGSVRGEPPRSTAPSRAGGG